MLHHTVTHTNEGHSWLDCVESCELHRHSWHCPYSRVDSWSAAMRVLHFEVHTQMRSSLEGMSTYKRHKHSWHHDDKMPIHWAGQLHHQSIAADEMLHLYEQNTPTNIKDLEMRIMAHRKVNYSWSTPTDTFLECTAFHKSNAPTMINNIQMKYMAHSDAHIWLKPLHLQ